MNLFPLLNCYLLVVLMMTALIASTGLDAKPVPPTASAPKATTPPASGEITYGPWRACKIGGGGYMQNVVFTSNPKVLYAYADVTGPWRSDDGGQRWRALYGNLPPDSAYGVRGLLVDPRNPNHIIVARGGGQWTLPDGLYISQNGGQTWHKTLTAPFNANETHRAAGLVLARNPRNFDEVLAAGGHEGVFRSRDNGQKWEKTGATGVFPTDLRFDRSNPRRIWLSAQQHKMWQTTAPGKSHQVELGGGFFRSDDGAHTWKKIAEKAPTELLQDPLDATRLYGLFEGKHVRLSRNGGDTWQDLNEGLASRDMHWMDQLNALGAGPDFILTATQRGNIYRLKSGETRWQKVERQGVEEIYEGQEWYGTMKYNKPGDWQHFGAALGSIVVNPRDANHWFFTDWYAVYTTYDAGKHWKLSMNGIELTVLHTFTQDPTDPGVVHMGMADNGYLWSENGGDRFYTPKITSNMKSIAVSPKVPGRIYGVGDGIGGQWSSNQVFVSIDRGHNWIKSPQVGVPDLREFKANTITVDWNDPYTVYLAVSRDVAPGKGGVYKSVDGGKTWTWLGQGLPTEGGQFFRDDIWGIGRELAVSPDGSMCAISRDRRVVYHFDSGQKIWMRCELKLNSNPYSVVADPHVPGHFFVGVQEDGVFRTQDGGKNWQRVLDRGTQHVAVDTAKGGRVLAGTARGVMLSRDGGATWQMLDERLPHRYYNIPAFAGDRVVAGTSGSGAYWMPLTEQAARPVVARPVQVAALPGKAPTGAIMRNGAMTQGAQAPDGWQVGWTGSGKLRAVRDTEEFKVGPASLRVESDGDPAYGNAGQNIEPTASPFTINGWVKSVGDFKEARVAVQAFDANYKQVAFINLAEAMNARDWTAFTGEVRLPADAKHVSLSVILNGTGRVWLDEVKVQSQPDIFLSPLASVAP